MSIFFYLNLILRTHMKENRMTNSAMERTPLMYGSIDVETDKKNISKSNYEYGISPLSKQPSVSNSVYFLIFFGLAFLFLMSIIIHSGRKISNSVFYLTFKISLSVDCIFLQSTNAWFLNHCYYLWQLNFWQSAHPLSLTT